MHAVQITYAAEVELVEHTPYSRTASNIDVIDLHQAYGYWIQYNIKAANVPFQKLEPEIFAKIIILF